LPPLGVELQYRIKSDREAHERVAVEHRLLVVGVAKSIVAAGSRLSSVDVNPARFRKAVVKNDLDHLLGMLGLLAECAASGCRGLGGLRVSRSLRVKRTILFKNEPRPLIESNSATMGPQPAGTQIQNG
jgi:hypothetical protein